MIPCEIDTYTLGKQACTRFRVLSRAMRIHPGAGPGLVIRDVDLSRGLDYVCVLDKEVESRVWIVEFQVCLIVECHPLKSLEIADVYRDDMLWWDIGRVGNFGGPWGWII